MSLFLVVATLVLNEVLYDPVGADSGREFVELLHPDSTQASWPELVLQMGDGAHPGTWRTVWQAQDVTLGPGGMLVIGGDQVPEAQQRLTGSLQNGPDAVRLLSGSVELDRIGYGDLVDASMFEGTPAADVSGVSLARLPDGRDTQDNAADLQAHDPSPGRRNQPQREWSILLREPDWSRFWPQRRVHVQAVVHNRGALPSTSQEWQPTAWWTPLPESSASAPADLRRESRVVPLSSVVAPGDSVLVDVSWLAEAGPFVLEVHLPDADDWSTNNHAALRGRVGAGAVVLNELLYAPETGTSEWIELWNRSRVPISLEGWSLEDASGRRAVLREAPVLDAGRFALLRDDIADDVAGAEPGALHVAARPWPSLNNTDDERGIADILTLRDAAGHVQDAVFYSARRTVSGRSLERVAPDATVQGVLWSLCKAPEGTTPGRPNSVSGPVPQGGRVSLSPNPFTPDGDGRDEVIHIRLEVPPGVEGFRARVFDLTGLSRRDLAADRLGPGPRDLVWDGLDNSGRPVELGVYVLHFEWVGGSGRPPRVLRTVGVVRR